MAGSKLGLNPGLMIRLDSGVRTNESGAVMQERELKTQNKSMDVWSLRPELNDLSFSQCVYSSEAFNNNLIVFALNCNASSFCYSVLLGILKQYEWNYSRQK